MTDHLNPVDGVTVTNESDAPTDSRGETRFAQLLDDERITVQQVSIPPGKVEQAHYHDAATYIYHLAGEVSVHFTGVDGEQRRERFGVGDLLRIPPYVAHEVTVVSERSVETIAMRVGDDVDTVYVNQ